MGLGEKLKDIIVKPYKSFENKFIPLVNAINNYLDKWFPQDKWNWRKIAVYWAGIQALIIGILQVIVIIMSHIRTRKIYIFVMGNSSDETWRQEVAIADPLIVYQMIFFVAQFFQFYLITDTITKSSTLQLIIGTFFSISISFYSIVQYYQQKEDKFSHHEKLTSINLHPAKNIEIAIIILMFIFCLGWIIITLRLYKIFGWNVFKQLGADIGVRNRLKLYQILISLLKIDIFLFTTFAMQYVVLVVFYIQNEDLYVKILNCSLIFVIFLMPFVGFWATKKEDYKLMFIFVVLLSVSIGYMVFSIIDIIANKKEKNEKGGSGRYRNCENSLSFACITSLVVGLITFVLALINFKNFPKGLKKDKSIHRPTSSNNNSTLSSSYNTPQRWSIE
eukprot:jgi/Orpsp1_1/1179865/evm.model.c7180000071108.1